MGGSCYGDRLSNDITVRVDAKSLRAIKVRGKKLVQVHRAGRRAAPQQRVVNTKAHLLAAGDAGGLRIVRPRRVEVHFAGSGAAPQRRVVGGSITETGCKAEAYLLPAGDAGGLRV